MHSIPAYNAPSYFMHEVTICCTLWYNGAGNTL